MDPVTEGFTAVVAIVKTAEEVGKLIARLSDHQRTLEQAEADRRAASEMLNEGPGVLESGG